MSHNRNKWTTFVLMLMIFLIGLIGVMDNLLNLKFMETLEKQEQNPMGLWMIRKFGVLGFIKAKAVTTVLVCGILIAFLKSRWRLVIIPSVFVFQVLLFLYLSYWTTDGLQLLTDFESKNFVLEYFFKFYKEYLNGGE